MASALMYEDGNNIDFSAGHIYDSSDARRNQLQGNNWENAGYDFKAFPAGKLDAGAPGPEYQHFDNKALFDSGLRGLRREQFPHEVNVDNDLNRPSLERLQDNFPQQQNVQGLADVEAQGGSVKFNGATSINQSIIDEFKLTTSTLNSNKNAPGQYINQPGDNTKGSQMYRNDAIEMSVPEMGIEESFKATMGVGPQKSGIPFAPFSYTYPNFGTNDGLPDYGFEEPGISSLSDQIIKEHYAMLPAAVDGTNFQKDLTPIFSGTNVLALEQRSIFQSKAKLKKALWRDGEVELPDDLRIDPRSVLMAGANIPTDIISTGGELMQALDTLGYSSSNGIDSTTPWGPKLPASKVVGTHPGAFDPSMYEFDTNPSNEGLVFSQRNRYPFPTGNHGQDKWLNNQ